jgi:hypothetical protein
LGERLLCKQEVIGSIPFTSTTAQSALSRARRDGSGEAAFAGVCAGEMVFDSVKRE